MMDHRRVSTASDLARVWVHETRRVFADRLISYEDKRWFEDLAKKQGQEKLGLDWDETIGAPGTPRSFLMYADFLIPGAEPKVRYIQNHPNDPGCLVRLLGRAWLSRVCHGKRRRVYTYRGSER